MQKQILGMNTCESEKSFQLKASMFGLKKRKSRPSANCHTNGIQNYYENSLSEMDLSKIKSLASQPATQSSATNAMKISRPNHLSLRKSLSIQS
jgi:hypothetical protein